MADESDDGTGGLVLGLGCARSAALSEVLALAEDVLGAAGFPGRPLRRIASLDRRAVEPAIIAVAARFGVPFDTFDAARLEAETPRLVHPSEAVYRRVGCHGVAEAAALAAAGRKGRLVVPKRSTAHATAAVAVRDDEPDQTLAAERSQIKSGPSCIESSVGAFSREADTGSREENASKQKAGVFGRSNRIGKCSERAERAG